MDFSAIIKFFLDEVYLRLFFVTVALFVIGFSTWFMYYRFSRRDLFKINSPGEKASLSDIIVYVLKYTTFFPLFTFAWFLFFVICLRLITQSLTLEAVMSIGIILISVIRLSAYFSEKMAEDLAKLLPLTLLVLLIIDPSQIKLVSLSELMGLKEAIYPMAQYLLFTISLEWILRISYSVYMKSKSK